MRHFHCTLVVLTSAISPNADMLFLCVEVGVIVYRVILKWKYSYSELNIISMEILACVIYTKVSFIFTELEIYTRIALCRNMCTEKRITLLSFLMRDRQESNTIRTRRPKQ